MSDRRFFIPSCQPKIIRENDRIYMLKYSELLTIDSMNFRTITNVNLLNQKDRGKKNLMKMIDPYDSILRLGGLSA